MKRVKTIALTTVTVLLVLSVWERTAVGRSPRTATVDRLVAKEIRIVSMRGKEIARMGADGRGGFFCKVEDTTGGGALMVIAGRDGVGILVQQNGKTWSLAQHLWQQEKAEREKAEK